MVIKKIRNLEEEQKQLLASRLGMWSILCMVFHLVFLVLAATPHILNLLIQETPGESMSALRLITRVLLFVSPILIGGMFLTPIFSLSMGIFGLTLKAGNKGELTTGVVLSSIVIGAYLCGGALYIRLMNSCLFCMS